MSTAASGPQGPTDPYGTPSGTTGWERPAEGTAPAQPAETGYSAGLSDPWGSKAPEQPSTSLGGTPSYQSGSAPTYGATYPTSQPSASQQIPPYVPPQQGMVTAPYGAVPPAPAQPTKPPVIGTVGLGLAATALVISIVLTILTANAYGELFKYLPAGTTKVDQNTLPPEAEPAAMRAGVLMLAQAVPTLLGIAGLVCSAIGLSKPGSKTLSAIGLALAILAPIISFVVFVAMMGGQLPR